MDIHVVRMMFLQGNLFSPLGQIESLTSQLLERLLSTVECVESLTFEHSPFVRAPVSEGLKCFKFQVFATTCSNSSKFTFNKSSYTVLSVSVECGHSTSYTFFSY